jgi:adenylate cyclase
MTHILNITNKTHSSPPEEIVEMLNNYFKRMIEIVFRHEGTLDKFIGDAIMAVFGTPVEHDDDPLRAVLTAIEMRQALRTFNHERLAEGKSSIEIGVGICNGEAVSGAIGSEERLEFTVIGDTVNVAARLEALTKSFLDHKILFNEPVYALVKDRVPCDFLIEELVKGKTQPIKIYGVSEHAVHSFRASPSQIS